MLIFEGGSAVSRFRVNKLCNQVRDSLTGLGELSARYLHVASTDRALSPKKRETLSRLLDYGAPAKVRSIGREILVFPRLGTTSPWSTKATDIAHHCGLTEIVRLERGVAWSVPCARRVGSPRSAAAATPAPHAPAAPAPGVVMVQ